MKRLLFLVVLGLFCGSAAHAQVTHSWGKPREVATKPANPCLERDFIQALDTDKASLCQDAVWVDIATGTPGSVTSVSVSTANGISGSVANATTTPAITLNISGLDATKIGGGGVTTAEFDFLGTVTSNVQTQIDAKPNVNSTNGIIPYRSSATAFADSPLTRTSSTVITSTAVLNLPNGIVTAPALAIANDARFGFWWNSTNRLMYSDANVSPAAVFQMDSAGTGVRSANQYRWFSNGTIDGGTLDTGIGRSAAANISITNGSSTSSWTLGSSGILAVTDNTLDIGAAGATRPRTGYFGTSLFTPLMGIGTTSPNVRLGQKLDVANSGNFGGMALSTWSATAGDSPLIDFYSSRNSTIGTQGLVANNNLLGAITFWASDGVAFQPSSQIVASTNATTGVGDVPGAIDFLVAPDGSATPTTRLLIGQAGNINFSGATFYKPGTPAIAGNGTLDTGSDDSAGKVTSTATGATTVVLTFSTGAFTRAPSCQLTNETTANLLRGISTTTTVTFAGTVVNGDKMSYTCLGY